VSVTTIDHSGRVGTVQPYSVGNLETSNTSDYIRDDPSKSSRLRSPPQSTSGRSQPGSRSPRSRVSTTRKLSSHLAPGSASPGSDRSGQGSTNDKDNDRRSPLGIIGICALDAKARSKPSRNILNKINSKQEFEVIIFGDKVILDEEPGNWPVCDYLISFFSDGFPLDKAIAYVRLRKPFCVNDLPMQMVLWDRRLCLQILDRFEVPTPRRVEVNRDGGPRLPSPEMAQHMYERTGVRLEGPSDGTGGGTPAPKKVIMLDEDTISVDGVELRKPFVEKPVNGEDHNINIYYSNDVGGGGRRLFRKINNKSSEADDSLNVPRSITDQTNSYIYESFLSSQNHEDVKAYTVGPDFCHAETRKSPVVDGIVKRNTHGKEIRYVTSLTKDEARIASNISEAFGQRVCGFDLLRVGDKSFVIDVNGWSFVKDNNDYYDKCANILKTMFIEERRRRYGKTMLLDGEVTLEDQLPTRPSGSHWSALKSILKTPSMSLLAGNNNHGTHVHDNSSLDLANQGTCPTSPRTFEKPAGLRSDVFPPLNDLGFQQSDHSHPLDHFTEYSEVVPPPPATKAQWRLKGMVAVIRHADRTPKQKYKFTFHTKPFVDLLKGHREEVLLVGEASLSSVLDAVKIAFKEGEEDPEKLKQLRLTLIRKGAWAGTKVQIKPMFRKQKANNSQSGVQPENKPEEAIGGIISTADEQPAHRPEIRHPKERQGSISDVTLSRAAAAEENLDIEKLQLIVKWGGEPTHSARYQAQELGENMRNDLLLMNRDAIEDLTVYSSSERRVTTSATIWTAAFLDQKEVSPKYIHIRKDLLDDSNAAKDEMDKVKKKLKNLLREGNEAPKQFTWPDNMPEPFLAARDVVQLMKFHRQVMKQNFSRLYGGAVSSLASHNAATCGTSTSPTSPGALSQMQAVNNIQSRWCCGEDAELFKERWEKLFNEFTDPEKVDPGKISELHDTMKFDALHNRQFLEWIFTPSQSMLDEFYPTENIPKSIDDNVEETPSKAPQRSEAGSQRNSISSERSEKPNIAQRMGFRKKSDIDQNVLKTRVTETAAESYFNLFTGSSRSNTKTDVRLAKLRELFMYAKILFDFIGPQEYGILNSEKLEIGLLTSLPLLKAIVHDLEDMQASDGAKTTVYFTKESHIYTLLNCIIGGGIKTKIERNKIPELDYLSTICFELYESQNATLEDESESFNYSIRITISPG